ncbi:MAG TPA: STAS domain-containing protein, partial [Anaerolineales bacterium]
MTTFLDLKFSQQESFVPVMVVQVAGELDSNTYDQFQTQVLREIETGPNHVLLDLSKLTYISSAGLRALYMISKALSAKGAQPGPHAKQAGQFKSPFIKLLNPSP